MRLRNTLLWVASVVLFFLFTSSLHAQEAVFELDPAQTHIEFTLSEPLRPVHGTFKVKSGTFRFNLATSAASGLVVLDVESEETGNPSFDRKIHKEVLESQKYPEAIFTPARVVGRLEAQGDSPLQLSGILNLHGKDHELNLAIMVAREGGRLTASTHTLIPYADWGLKNPSTLFLHLGNQVEIFIKAAGRITLPPAK